MNTNALLDFAAVTVESLDVVSLARELLTSEQITRDGRTARTLAKSEGLTAVLTAVRAGGSVSEHSAPGPVIIVPLIGTAIFSGGDGQRGPRQVSVGHMLCIGKGQRHEVAATEDCAFLIIIGLQS